jgi:F-type H+-transporting ATPase subunit b
VSINATLLGQMLTFAVFVWFTMKFVWPILTGAMEERATRIADGLAASEKGKHELEQAEERAKVYMREGKTQAAEAMANAQKRGDEIIEEAKQAARVEGDKIIAAAKAQVDQEIQQAKERLQQEVAKLAIAGAEQVLMREVDANAHKDILGKLGKSL